MYGERFKFFRVLYWRNGYKGINLIQYTTEPKDTDSRH